jgi:hypothetical protein
MKQNNKVTQLKCAFSNAVHKLLVPDYNKKESERKKVNFSNEQKLEIFDQIMALHNEGSKRISQHRFNKRAAKRKYLKMIEEGKLPKQKTTLSQWIEMQKVKEAV